MRVRKQRNSFWCFFVFVSLSLFLHCAFVIIESKLKREKDNNILVGTTERITEMEKKIELFWGDVFDQLFWGDVILFIYF